MRKYFTFISVLVLLILGLTFAVGFIIKNGTGEVLQVSKFFFSYLSLVLSILKENHYVSEGTKARKVMIIVDQNSMYLQKKLNDALYSLKKKTIINVQMVDTKTAIIVYTE